MVLLSAAALLVLVVLLSGVRVELPMRPLSRTEAWLFVVAREPVGVNDSVIVCVVTANATSYGFIPASMPVLLRWSTDQYYWDRVELNSPGCTNIRIRRVVTNILWVEAVLPDGRAITRTVGASGRILLATSDIILLLVALNIIQFAVIVFLLLKVSGRI